MKKMLQSLVIVFLLSGWTVSAQVLTSKKGIPILPVAGDFAIGISATPILDFAGNLIKINSNNAFASGAAWNFIGQHQTIYAKYFLKDNMAIRARLRIHQFSKTITATSIQNQTKNFNPYKTVEDKWTHTGSNIVLSGGLEKRRGYGRLQGFYGAELTFALTGASNDEYSYGNSLDSLHQYPDRTNFNNNIHADYYIKYTKTKSIFGFGVGAFAGIEYFVLPKISIGGEFNWNIGWNLTDSHGEMSQSIEYWGTPPGSPSSYNGVQSVTQKIGKNTYFNIDNSQTGGNLFLLFHF